MVHLPRPQLPSTQVVVSGPGPVERHGDNDPPTSEPPRTGSLIDESNGNASVQPPLPPRPAVAPPRPVEKDEEGDGSDEEPTSPAPKRSDDPYSNLDSAFSNYLADEPRPMGAGAHRGRDDDLLF
jgi:hypothetical protein